MTCGQCCAHFRVSFYWAEADDAPDGWVPHSLTEKLNLHLRCMKGTDIAPRRCIALNGVVGKNVACGIYAQRPTPCREFEPWLESGQVNEKCNELRQKAGLNALQPLSLLEK